MSEQNEINFNDDQNKRSPKEIKFLEYHLDNPEVYVLFKKYAFNIIKKGTKRYGARCIIELVRYHHHVNEGYQERGEFKICNNHIPYYARLFLKDFPEHKGFFELKELRS